MRLAITGGYLIDPANGYEAPADLFIEGRHIVGVGHPPEGFSAEQQLDASGQWLIPGLIDLQARLREPGFKHKGTIESESRAAAAGGVTTLCVPPDSRPVLDNPALVEQLRRRAAAAGYSRVLPIGALTQGLAGEQLAAMYGLKQAGCVAVSNARQPIRDTLVLRRALEYAATLDLPVLLHAEDPWLAARGCVHEGVVSNRLGLPGIPECAEVIAVARDLVLIEQSGVRAHFGQISSARAVELIAEAQQRGLPVSADVSAHQLFLTEIDVGHFDARAHVRPPLRTQRDRDGLRAALADGVISAVCSDHQPHDRDAKLAPFAATEPGISAVETLLPLLLRLVDAQLLSRRAAIAAVTSGPAQILCQQCGSLGVGARADIAIVDPQQRWQVNDTTLQSRGKNTPLQGWELQGRVTCTLLEGRVVHQLPHHPDLNLRRVSL